jgi:hypothetical protein
MKQRRRRHRTELLAIADATIVFPPSHLADTGSA